MAGRFALVPNARNAMVRATRKPGSGSRLRLSYELQIQANGSPAPAEPRIAVEAEIRGPGDIVGFNRRIISRVEPTQGLRGFEPNYLPFVEFIDADFPWRYSLDPGTETRPKPWLVLLALQPGEFEFVAQGRGPLPRIRVFSPADSLPDLAHSWAHAHVQVNLAKDSSDVAAVVGSDPEAHFSRLFCPRRLQERASYHLFLVPAYEAGRLAGLGERGAASPFDAPAWSSAATTPVELPVYFQSRFTTNQLEDVETLLRRLRGVEAGSIKGLGETPLASAERPGYYEYEKDEKTFEIQGALRQPGAAVEPYNTDPDLADLLVPTLQEVIEGERVEAAQDGPDVKDPLVAMPAYGWRFRGSALPSPALSRARAQSNQWFDRVNLDLKFRHAAGLGAEVVRSEQELFASKCWEQYEEVLEANRQLQRLRFAEVMVERTTRRRLARLPAEVAMSLSEPLHGYVRVAEDRTVLDVVRGSGIPTGYVSRSLRRLSSKRPVHLEAPGAPPVVAPAPAIPGDQTPSPVLQPLRTPVAPAPVPDTPLRVPTTPPRTPATPFRMPTAPFRSRGARAARQRFLPGVEQQLRTLLGATAFQEVPRVRGVGVPVGEIDSASLADKVFGKLVSLPAGKAASVIGGRLPSEQGTLDPVYRSPVVPLPLSTYLRNLDRDRLLSGVDRLPENTVSAFEENRHFIEAFLVGANHAMNNELRWREFPTDMRGTIFRRFWDRGRLPDDPRGDDIAQIHTWTRGLGGNFPPTSDGEADLVVVIRGDIVRKLGQMVVVLNEATGERWESGKGKDHAPVFFGRIGRDVAYYGFDISRRHILSDAVKKKAFLVLYEPMGQMRFGVDVATAAVRRARRSYESLPLGFPVGALARSYDQVPGRGIALAAAPPAKPAKWDDLSWSHVPHSPSSGYIDFGKTIGVTSGPDHWGSTRTSASIARSLWQKPLAAVLPLSRVL